MHAAADAHDAREAERAAKKRKQGDDLVPVVVNIDDYKDELQDPKNAELLAELGVSGVQREDEEREETQPDLEPEPAAVNPSDAKADALEAENPGRHAFRKRNRASKASTAKASSSPRRPGKVQANLLSFGDDE